MNLNYPHYIFPKGKDLFVVKFPPQKGRVLFALETDLNKLHFWLAHSKAGTVVEINEEAAAQTFIAVLYQHEGKQYSKIFKPIFSRKESNVHYFDCETTDVTVAKAQFDKTYVNRLIVEMAADYAELREAFLEAFREVEESKILVNKPKLILN